ncbi:MAG: TIM barrel protein [Eudoraea sp.]|nr:TIM barrel protein [Eudoraea sp.]
MKRRNFLKNTTALVACSAIPNYKAFAQSKALNSIGIQLFSLPKLLENDFTAAIQMLAQMGYKEVELYGPFPYSATSAKEGWKMITPNLGFSGSGYFGHTPKEVKSILKENGIQATSIHTDLDTLQTRMEQLGEAGDEIGFNYIGLPAIPPEKRKTLDDYKMIAEAFNKIGEQAKEVGLKFAYHNHGYGLHEMDGHVPMNIILDQTDPDLVFFEMDIFWTTAGGADPVSYLEAYPDRYHLMHLKDMKEKVQFSGDGGDPGQWIQLFPYMTTAGDGVLDIPSIISAGKKMGVTHFYVEQDMVAQPEMALKRSIDYLKAI